MNLLQWFQHIFQEKKRGFLLLHHPVHFLSPWESHKDGLISQKFTNSYSHSKSDIRENFGCHQHEKNQEETLSTFRKHWFYISLSLSHLLMHTPMFIPFAAHLSLRVNHSYLHEPTPALWLGVSSFTFSHHEALPPCFISFFLVHLLHFPLLHHTSPIFSLDQPLPYSKMSRKKNLTRRQFQFCHQSVLQPYSLVFPSVQWWRVQTDDVQEPSYL